MIYNWWIFHIYRLLLGINTGNGMKWCMSDWHMYDTGADWHMGIAAPKSSYIGFIYIYIYMVGTFNLGTWNGH